MIVELLLAFFRWLVLMAFQIAMVRHMHIASWILFFPYVLFILQLPFETSRFTVLTLAFITGYTIDVFYHTNGIHAMACISLALVRSYYINTVTLREGLSQIYRPHIKEMGAVWFFQYAFVLILLHHFMVFFLEQFSMARFWALGLRVILSSLATLLMVWLIQRTFTKPKTGL